MSVSSKRIKKVGREKEPASDLKANKDTCFVIMPYGGWFDKYYDVIYQPAVADAGLNPKRADDLYLPNAIANDIWAYTNSARVILADLSNKNANVFYELGLAHALTKPAILVSESKDDIPFDLRHLRVIYYDKNDPCWGDALRTKITEVIKMVIQAPEESILPVFREVKEGRGKTVSETENKLLETRRELELLKSTMSLSGGT